MTRYSPADYRGEHDQDALQPIFLDARCTTESCLADRCPYEVCDCACHRYPFACIISSQPDESIKPISHWEQWKNAGKLFLMLLLLYGILGLGIMEVVK